ncbi:MAG: FAD-dependent oxidoreductase [Hyphomonadaceae bacterium]|nr:FAD-dependent oxidoreductase [Hyphomonadaceae bacterium]
MSGRVIIVGAGIIGMFCALRLQQRGAHVIVLEGESEDQLGAFCPMATLAAAGMLAPVSEASGPPERHALLDRLALDSFDLWRSQSKGALWEDGLRFDGGIFIAANEFEAADMQQQAARLGRSAKPMPAAQVCKRTGLNARVDHALFVEDEGVADPVRVLSGLVMDARRHGVQVLFGHDVDQVEANKVTVHGKGAFEADTVLLAPGVWASAQMLQVAPVLKQVRPARGHVVPIKLAQPLKPNVHGQSFYFAPRLGDDVVLGSTMEFDRFDRGVDPDRVQQLLAAAELMFPGEVQLRPNASPWVGVRPMSPDWGPIIGKSGDVLVACGHSRNGWLLAPVTAEIICGIVFGETLTPHWAAFQPDRFGISA